ncbi:hypothetical protein P7266_1064 [Lactococcus cremoris]|nr:hypothetical protein P7266_1064 [Lactococcus cremoris]
MAPSARATLVPKATINSVIRNKYILYLLYGLLIFSFFID